MYELRLAFRSFRRRPAFSALAVLIVALGAGANAAVFSVFQAVLLRPLPYADPDRLAAIAPETFFSAAEAQLLQERARGFAEVASSSPGWMMSMLGAGEPVQIIAARPSANLFRMLGVQPALGRGFDDPATAGREVVLGHALWRARFGGDPQAIGRVITLDGVPRAIVGVLPPAAGVLDVAADAWAPFDPGGSFARGRNRQLYGRLRAGVTPEAATRDLQALLPDLRRDAALPEEVRALPVLLLTETLVGDVRRPLSLVTVAVGLLLVLTAANLGTLILGREVGRRRDAAVRVALGGSRARLVRLVAAENVLLAVAGGLVGFLLARLALPALLALLPRDTPRLGEVALDPSAMTVVMAVTTTAVLLFAVLPALLGQPLSFEALRQGAQTQAPRARRMLDALVVTQLAFTVVLGAAAALMLRSLWTLQKVDPGFVPDRVLSLRVQPSGERYPDSPRRLDYHRAVGERVAAVPGVAAVGWINHLPLSGYDWTTAARPDRGPQAGRPQRIGWRMTDGDYFGAMGIPLRAGRSFRRDDGAGAALVAILNEAAARRFFASPEQALGRSLHLSGPTGEQRVEVVGVVGDVRHRSIAIAPAPEMYRPVAQTFTMALTLVARTSGPPASYANAVRSAVWSADPAVAIAALRPLRSLVGDDLGRPRMLATLLLAFSAVGLLIVLCGVYGVVAYSVRRREREIAIRLALGATPQSVARLVLGKGLRYAALALVAGVPAALAAGGLVRGLLFGVEPSDPAAFATLTAVVVLTTVAATLVPAARAGRVEPAAVLKGE